MNIDEGVWLRRPPDLGHLEKERSTEWSAGCPAKEPRDPLVASSMKASIL